MHSIILPTVEAYKPSISVKPRNVFNLMLTKPGKYSSCITENKPKNIAGYTVLLLFLTIARMGRLFFPAIPRTFTSCN